MKKVNMKINKTTWKRLKEFNGASMDEKLNTLINVVEDQMPQIILADNTKNVKCFEDTYDRIDSYRLTKGESRDNIITRMLIMFDEMNNTVSTEFISFKLTNPYNNLLVIDGQLEYNTRELSFNYRGNVYTGKLPANYIVNGKDLTKELYLWYDNLNWQEIINLLIENVDNQTVIDKKDYSLEINDIFNF